MLYASFASFCQQLFSKFFQKAASAPLFPAPQGFLRAAVPQRVRGYAQIDPACQTLFSDFLESFLLCFDIFLRGFKLI